MKFVLAGVAIVAAIAALIFRPPIPSQSAARDIAIAAPRDEVAKLRPRPKIVVYVAGEVAHPGVYAFGAESRATDALARAGGAKSDADLVAVNLAAPLHDGDEVAVPKIGATVSRARRSVKAPTAQRTHKSTRARGASQTSVAAAPTSVDLNLADARELTSLPGVGASLAARIIAFREENGAFTSVEDLADVSGITPHLIDQITPYVTTR